LRTRRSNTYTDTYAYTNTYAQTHTYTKGTTAPASSPNAAVMNGTLRFGIGD
jgi:hypothetical protein